MRDWLSYICFRLVYQGLALFPHRVLTVITGVTWLALFKAVPRLKKTINVNLRIAFPAQEEQWYREMISKHAREMGRLSADIIRLPSIDRRWMEEHVRFKNYDRYQRAQRETGALLATGHLGSFELLGHLAGLSGSPVVAIARKFKSDRLNRWWESMRQASGNTIIDRKGAFKKMIQALDAKQSVAVLFDQNVKRKHAVFVPWFSMQAATTKSLALAVLQTSVPVFVASIRFIEGDIYEVWIEELDFSEVKSDSVRSEDQKIQDITACISNAFCERIVHFPEGWFWSHRRWKTRPEEGDRSPYSRI